MPNSLNLFNVVRRWHFAADAFLRWVYSSTSATCVKCRVLAWRVIGKAAIIALAAVRAWHTVKSVSSLSSGVPAGVLEMKYFTSEESSTLRTTISQ